MLIRIACGVVLAAAVLVPEAARADCSQVIGQVMSRDTERLATRYHRISQRMQKQGRSPRLIAEKCRIARQLEPQLVQQVSTLRQSGCGKDPEVGPMVVDIVRGREDDLASMRKIAQTQCK
jgi:hypothetical protein